jgi:hypothetical protein
MSSHYYDKGFLSVRVAAPRVMLTPDRSGIDIVLTIDEGPHACGGCRDGGGRGREITPRWPATCAR